MMNKCTDQIWFVVELCESIKAVKMELANFELYSSVPHEFRVTMSNTYPPKEKDWALFGQFRAENDRSVQTFQAEGGGVFGKYARVEVLSHHGEEHFCLVSHFKMFGVSEIELLGGDDDDDDDEEEPVTVGGEDSTFEEGLTSPEESSKGNSNGIVSYIKEKVDETIERFVGVFRPRRDDAELMSTALNETSLSGNTLAYRVVCPDCHRDRYREVYFFLASNFAQFRRALELSSLRRSMEEGICQSLGFHQLESTSATCSASLLSDFYRTLFGSSRTVALCNVIALERRVLKRAAGEKDHHLLSSTSQRNDCEGGEEGEAAAAAAATAGESASGNDTIHEDGELSPASTNDSGGEASPE